MVWSAFLLLALGSLASASPKARGLLPWDHEVSHSNVIRGKEVTPHSYPSVVWINAWGECQGHLISNEWVVTIAQCIAPAAEATLVFGAHNIVEGEPEQVKRVSTTFIVHEDYDAGEFLNDIALVQLTEPVEFTPAIQPADLPAFCLDAGTNAMLVGWGQFDEVDPAYSDVLREGNVTISTDGDCEAFYGFSTPHTICIMTDTGSAPFCQGDFGGGLYKDNAFHGLASFYSSGGCDSGGGDCYTEVCDFTDWIKEHTGL